MNTPLKTAASLALVLFLNGCAIARNYAISPASNVLLLKIDQPQGPKWELKVELLSPAKTDPGSTIPAREISQITEISEGGSGWKIDPRMLEGDVRILEGNVLLVSFSEAAPSGVDLGYINGRYDPGEWHALSTAR